MPRIRRRRRIRNEDLGTQPIVSNPDPGGHIAQSYRRKRQKMDQIRIRLMIMMVCFGMALLTQ